MDKILIMIMIGMISVNAAAKDFGIVGTTWQIAEKDAIEEIQEKLSSIDLNAHNEFIRKTVEDRIKNPMSLNLRRTEKPREYKYDPTIEVKEDLKDLKDMVFQKAGTRINPLDLVTLSYEVIFFDATDKAQLNYALEKHSSAEIKPRLILTGGSPLDIEKDHNLDVYYDQQGILTKKLGIEQVPAEMKQEGKVLVLQEVMVK